MKIMKIITIAVAAMLISFSVPAEDAQKKNDDTKKTQKTCPVMGGKIDKKLYTDVNGKRIYVCCPGCIDTINEDPDKYINALEEEGILLEETPASEDNQKEKSSHPVHNH